ncbi:MAG: RibD family protein [Candidatus Competibacterales bacterium]|nr:RibD family protein [Candidatus Competibacterales bacterium]
MKHAPLDAARVWHLLLALRRLEAGRPALPLTLDADGRPTATGAVLTVTPDGWHSPLPVSRSARRLLSLYLPLFQPVPGRASVLAHLGQSLDGCIAAADGSAAGLNGPANIDHLHRLRALSDAILIGAGTAAADNPRLTTRRVAGASPVRVVLDPRRQLPAGLGLFHDGAAPTLILHQDTLPASRAPGRAELVGVAGCAAGLDPEAVLAALRQRGLQRVFIEGGGVTVSRFLAAGRIDRLQLTIAPLLLGNARRGLRLPPVTAMHAVLRAPCRRFVQGRDLLFDFDLRAQAGQANRS